MPRFFLDNFTREGINEASREGATNTNPALEHTQLKGSRAMSRCGHYTDSASADNPEHSENWQHVSEAATSIVDRSTRLRAKKSRKTASLYVVIAENGWCKIGISAEPKARLATLQTGNPHRLTMPFISERVCEDDARRFEALAHRMCRRHRGIGEWFSSNPELVCIIAAAAMMMPDDMEKHLNEGSEL